MEMKDTLRNKANKPKATWVGKYKDVDYEICSWFMENGETIWNYYLGIRLDKIKDEGKRESLWLPSQKMDFLNGIKYDYFESPIEEWFWHGGCTFYEKVSGLDGENCRIIKVGCDYAHACDTERYYSLDTVLRDVGKTIDSFQEWVGVYQKTCDGCRELFDPGTGVANDTRCGGDGEYCQDNKTKGD